SGENTIAAKFDRYGVRVPLIVVSPFAKKGYVGHATYDHTSILRFIEAKFKVPALTARDANADALMDLFDFKNPPNVTPPTIAAPTVDPAGLTYCETTYPHDGGL
ncbi:MAG TPA: alkaline phosphatase family protein, partial [Polyangiaceae bacterium]